MGLFDKKKKKEEEEALAIAGWEVITEAFEKIYPEQKNPKHYGTLIKWRLGGNDPLDGISIYDGEDYWHFVTFGMSEQFFFGQIKKGARMKDFEVAIEWLLDCGLIKKVYKVNKPAMPLKAYMDFSSFKLFLLDVGLLGALSELEAGAILEGNEIFVEFKGALTEQYVLQELMAETDYTPYYFGTDSHNYEMDFMVQKGRDAVPVEVKAETSTQAKSMKAYYRKYEPKHAVRISMLDYVEQDYLTNIPLYAVCNI